jgi:hypothetical protein
MGLVLEKCKHNCYYGISIRKIVNTIAIMALVLEKCKHNCYYGISILKLYTRVVVGFF